MKWKIGLGTLVVMVIFGFSSAHKYYVSVTQVVYSKKEDAVQITSRIFIDDLQVLVRERYDENAKLSATHESANIDPYLAMYFQEKLKIRIDENIEPFVFLGKEYENDVLLCYLEIRNIRNPKVFEIQNRILMDVFETQQNIIHVKKGGARKSLLLEKEKAKDMLKFSE